MWKWSVMLSMRPLEMSLFQPAHCCGWPGRSDSRVLEQGVFHQRRSEWWNGKKVNKTSVHVVSVSLFCKVSDDTFFSSFTFFLVSFFFCHIGPVLLHVIAEAVILGHASPGSAGSEHWTKSSSGGLPESRPSWLTHCKEEEITHSLEPLVLLIKLTYIDSLESAAGCTWRWCRGLSPSWHIQKWKSSLYTGPSWWRQATRPQSSHWTRGWTVLPYWDAKQVHILFTVSFRCFVFEKENQCALSNSCKMCAKGGV